MFKTYMEKNIKLSIKDRKVGLKNVNTFLFLEIYTKLVRGEKPRFRKKNKYTYIYKENENKNLINQIGQNITQDI